MYGSYPLSLTRCGKRVIRFDSVSDHFSSICFGFICIRFRFGTDDLGFLFGSMIFQDNSSIGSVIRINIRSFVFESGRLFGLFWIESIFEFLDQFGLSWL